MRRFAINSLSRYKTLPIGNPLDRKTVMGPLIDKHAVDMVQDSIQRLKDEGGEVLYGGERLTVPGGAYMKPCLTAAKPDFEIVKARNIRSVALSDDVSRFR